MNFTSVFAAVSLLAILVFIHELGHFVAAKACGVGVRVFSIGFGRRVIGFRHRGTDYRISALPFGGYVQMSGADPFGYADEDDDLGDPSRAFQTRPAWQRLVVLAAGPVFNLILPVVVFTALLMAGEPQPAPVIGSVEYGSAAWQAGMSEGDRVLAVDGKAIETYSELIGALGVHGAGDVGITVSRGGQSQDLKLALTLGESGKLADPGFGHERLDTQAGVADPSSPAGVAGLRSGDKIREVGGARVETWAELKRALSAAGDEVSLSVDGDDGKRALTMRRDDNWHPYATGLPVGVDAQWGLEPGTLFIGDVGESVKRDAGDFLAGCRPAATAPPTPARLAGLQKGDRFLRLNGEPVATWSDVLSAVRGTMEGEGEEAHARPMQVEVMRAGQVVTAQLVPEVIRDTDAFGEYFYRPILGVARMGGYTDGDTIRVYYPFPDAVKQAVSETTMLGTFIVAQIGKLLTGEAAVQKSLGGPVEMFRQAGQAAERGLFDWARLLGMLSVSLGIVNLLPLPVLDGGQIVFHTVEAVRGRPLSIALRERVQQVGLLFLVLLMLSVMVFDLQRWFEGPG